MDNLIARVKTIDTTALQALNKAIVNELNDRARQERRHVSSMFKTDEIVGFWHQGAYLYMKIRRLNDKSVTGVVVNRDGSSIGREVVARVSPHALEKLETPNEGTW